MIHCQEIRGKAGCWEGFSNKTVAPSVSKCHFSCVENPIFRSQDLQPGKHEKEFGLTLGEVRTAGTENTKDLIAERILS